MFIFRDYTLDNELRYMSIADEALRNGDIFTFTNHGIDYADKPPLYLWIVMLGKVLFGKHSMLFLGIFSFIPALVILYIMDKWVKNLVPEKDRLSGQLMLITSGYFIGSALVMRMDMLMCMFIVLSLYTFFRIYSDEGKPRDKYLFPVYVFMAIFSKGPVGILVPLLSTVVFLIVKGKIKTIERYWGRRTLSILLVCLGIWFLGVYLEGGTKYLDNLLFNQTVNRALDSFHHKEPIYYYLRVIWYSLAPWSFLYIGVLIMGLKKRLMKTDLEKFFVVIALSTFVMLSLVSSKIEIYMLPAFPFFAYIAVLWLSRFDSQKWMYYLVGIPASIFTLALPGMIVAGGFTNFPLFQIIPLPIAALTLTIAGVCSIISLFRKKLNLAIFSIAAGMLFMIFSVSFALPKLNVSIGMGELCHKAKEQATQKNIHNYYFFNIKRFENTDVYLGTEPKMISENELVVSRQPENAAVNVDTSNVGIRAPAILFIRKKDIGINVKLSSLIEGREKYAVGEYFFVIL
ncbi:MAG: dolichyl-phosphate-mannose--protein mannosyltransferase [Rikenellaceae bacterium]